MRRAEALEKISRLEAALRQRKVASLSILGSLARDEAHDESDIDLLVEFSEPVGLFEFVRLSRFLEEALGVPVDLVTSASLKKQLRDRILKEAVRAA